MPDDKKLKVVKKTTVSKRANPTLEKDRLGGTPNTSTYKRSKMSISNELMANVAKEKGRTKTRTKAPHTYSRKITKVKLTGINRKKLKGKGY
jgi:hypothetical protein